MHEVLLEKVKFGLRRYLHPGMLQSRLSVDLVADEIAGQMAWELKAHIYGKQPSNSIIRDSVMVPARWFDAFLIQTKVGRLLQRFRKPTYRRVVLEVELSTRALYPTIPDMGNDHVAVLHHDLFTRTDWEQ